MCHKAALALGCMTTGLCTRGELVHPYICPPPLASGTPPPPLASIRPLYRLIARVLGNHRIHIIHLFGLLWFRSLSNAKKQSRSCSITLQSEIGTSHFEGGPKHGAGRGGGEGAVQFRTPTPRWCWQGGSEGGGGRRGQKSAPLALAANPTNQATQNVHRRTPFVRGGLSSCGQGPLGVHGMAGLQEEPTTRGL